MKILLLTTHLNIGGISTYTVSLAKALKAKGNDVFVVSSGGVLLPELAQGGVSHIKLDMFTKSELSPKVVKSVFDICKLVNALGIDIIHAETRVTQVIGFFASKLCAKPLVTTCHGFFKRNLGRFLFPAWGDRVIAISEAVYEHLVKDFHIHKDKISLIYNGIDVKKFLRETPDKEKEDLKQKIGIVKNYSVLGTIARFTPDKGQDVLLSAFREILKQFPNCQLIFVGDGKERFRIIDLTQRFNLAKNVVFVKSQLNTVNILSIIDVFMFTPKRKEGMGIALLEALASGKPVVATNVGGVSSVIKDGINGFLVEPSKPELLVEPALMLLKDKVLYKKMSDAGREIVIEKFSIDGMTERVEGVYRRVAKK